MPCVALVVAMTDNRVIGRDNDLPWRLSSDLKYFKKITMGKPIVMGRKTYDSIGKPLPGRTNIVITRDTSYSHEGVITAHSLETALEIGMGIAAAKGEPEVMVIGGGEIFKLALPIADRLYLTKVKGEVEGDAYFPEWSTNDWVIRHSEDHSAGDKDSHDYSFVVLDRVSSL
ncbi:MAG: type 3 dihydrofolate reductase [Kordiimonas sp.]|nr:type 3 dihydrofolate reductase [Kordiimonas sp.]|tara:strand:- start:2957 stop:3472 length:516 start_codon:yes stop_codon:yes gene_type:complete